MDWILLNFFNNIQEFKEFQRMTHLKHNQQGKIENESMEQYQSPQDESHSLKSSIKSHYLPKKNDETNNIKLITTLFFFIVALIVALFSLQFSQYGCSSQLETNRLTHKDKPKITQLTAKGDQDDQTQSESETDEQEPLVKDFDYYLKVFMGSSLKDKKISPQQLHIYGKKIYRNTEVSYEQMANAKLYTTLVENPNDLQLAKKEYDYYEGKYNISQYEEMPFCVVVSGYNNKEDDRYKRNILSILQQNYTNYHIVFYDDASTDGTGKAFQQFIATHPLKDKVTKIIINTINKSSLENLVDAARNHCLPKEIFFRVDGDDEMIGKQVLKFFNAVYHQKPVWNVYATSITTKNTIGLSRRYSDKVIANNDYRFAHFSFFHQTSFYTQLILKIKDEDLKDSNGQFLRASSDNVLLTPIYEMCHDKIAYMPEVTYLWRKDTGINEFARKKAIQRQVGTRMKSSPKYTPLVTLFDQKL